MSGIAPPTGSPVRPVEAPAKASATAAVPAAVTSGPTAAQIVATWRTDWAKGITPGNPADAAEAAKVVAEMQQIFAPANGGPKRAQHAKALYTTTRAELRVPGDLPTAVAHGPFAPGSKLRAIVRVSNVAGTAGSDQEADLRGIAIRLTDDAGHIQDLMLNTSERFMAKDVEGAIIGAQVRGKGLGILLKSVRARKVGVWEAIRMVWEFYAIGYRSKATATPRPHP